MTDTNRFTFTEPAPGSTTAEVVRRFLAAFQSRDAARIRELVAPDCVMEAMQPAPDGLRVEGYEANVAFWEAMVADPNGSFEVEDVVISGDRATNRWRYRFGTGKGSSVRGVTLIQVRDGRIMEALAYAKTPRITDLGQEATPTAMKQVVVAGWYTVDPERREEVIESFKALVLRARCAPGCLDLAITADPVDPTRINLFELWRSEKDLKSWRAVARPSKKMPRILSMKVHKHIIERSGPPF